MTIKVVRRSSNVRHIADPFEYAPGYLFTYDWECQDYDWLVVYDEMPDGRIELSCPREHTILATTEPTSIKHYSKAYTSQFGHLLTNRPYEAERHPHYHLGRGYYWWFNDRSYTENAATVLPPKSKLISTVCSSKQMRHTKHFARYKLTEALQSAVPEMEWYGHGVRGFGKKYEVMDPYKYHVTVENHIAPHHWSEKIADAFLCECLPFYAGAPDLAEDFPRESFIPIPIDDPAEAVRIVKAAIAEGAYEKRREAVLEAKRLILSKYNFWAQVLEVIKESDGDVSADGKEFLYARKTLRKKSLRALLDDGLHHFRQYVVDPFMR